MSQKNFPVLSIRVYVESAKNQVEMLKPFNGDFVFSDLLWIEQKRATVIDISDLVHQIQITFYYCF